MSEENPVKCKVCSSELIEEIRKKHQYEGLPSSLIPTYDASQLRYEDYQTGNLVCPKCKIIYQA